MPNNNHEALAETPHRAGLWLRLHHLLFDTSHSQGIAHTVNRWLSWVILISSLALVLELNPQLAAAYADAFAWIDIIAVTVFSVEYLLRLGCAGAATGNPDTHWPRLRWALRPYALIDLIAIAPFFLAPFLPFNADMMRLLRLARLARLLKLGRLLGNAWQEFRQLNQGYSLRATLFALLEPTSRSGQLHRYLDNFIIFWVLVSIASTILESVAAIRLIMGSELAVLDAIAFSIFFVEYGARWYAAAENPAYRNRLMPRWAYMRSTQAIIDLLAILPFLLERFLPWPLDLRFLRVFRLLRLLKLTRYASATGTLLKVIQREWPVILASVFVMLLLVVLTASMGYLFEHEAQPDKFENIPQTIYWAVITLSSVGYGDISPVTPMGRALTVVLSLLGIGIFAIPAGLLASAFTDQLRMDREQLKQRLQDALKHGALDAQAQEWLIAETHRLHLSPEDVQRLKSEAQERIEQQRQAMHSNRPVLLDPGSHPDLAAAQFRLLVEQLQLLHQASDPQSLQQQLPEASAARRVLQALHHPDDRP